MLNFRIKNGSRVPTTISATHLKMHALFWSTLQQGKDIIPTRKPLVTISSIRYKVGNTPFYCSWYKTFVFRYHKLNYVCLVVYAGRFVHISPTNHHFPSLLRVQDEDRGRRHRGLKEVHKRCGENATAAWNVSFWN
ncbi:uncharacterized protein LOC110917101 isoform X2 [Helianthus annuus]|uniref:uncharacterized protein LOC110872200 isoform X2 n=1 Tax=Helianthus annuus TaxID=4232 RepID=UPI001652C549|nr:uncharacterized protein LOC110872200 isoform X2 [Helianthus annuus]XP_035841031.1 uncharacterized protein LOC110917101 isoform X2 [Helianthus annuus]